MSREIRLNAFEMNCIGHQSPGLWRHPDDRSADYHTLEYWTDLATILERGRFDGLFLADVLGTYDVYGGNADAALRNAIQVPVNDPLMPISAMAAVTRHLGFGVTATLSYEPPFTFARRMSTLDHLTRGRIGWNIVTGYLDSAARGQGRERQTAHDDRYDLAEEYMEVVYRLWEGSWEDDAVLRNKERGIFADPAKVHKVSFEGRHYRVDAIHLCEPSPQRTPVLYQAGSSTKGRAFAARHAECVFVSGPSAGVIAKRVASIRALAAEAGRDPAAIRIFSLATLIPGETDAEASAKLADYRRFVSEEGALVLFSGWTGIDLARFRPDEVVEHVRTEAGHAALENITVADPAKRWTVGEVAAWGGIGGIGPVVAGTPARIADWMEEWIEATGVDGFNLAYALSHRTFSDVADLVVPELTRRGRYKQEYRAGTLRTKLGGPDSGRLAESHPAATFRRR
ncbi:MAG TPA: LLM class flavin-dependent oxidoreductase [Geminicoccus sp.]|uniref:LLM class flavin-dependent oxidoreductase n=1 Tax=Geminicoccus sp. TaxID=2024832 RepID=UPI002C4DED88|nr:LLM class flavin-dependent oxidoreductase [Geminicoccus sp.]HWL69716.1 LLM class flavin-dependent oxidoreductase [Geminicoccus sp.]